MIISNIQLLELLDTHVEGHEQAKKSLIALLQRSKVRYYQKYLKCMDEENLLEPMKVLLVGGSGTGKSHLVHTLTKVCDFIFVSVDATQFNVTGGSGGIKVGFLKKMIRDAAELALTEYPYKYFSLEGAIDRTVVLVDEICKLGGSGNVGEWNRNVQSDFLTLFDNKDAFSGVSFIFTGAFSEITKYKSENKAGNLGFVYERPNGYNLNADLDEKIINTGILPELIGRMTSVVELDVFTEEDLYNIMVKRIVPKKARDLAAFNVFDVSVSEGKLRAIAKAAFTSSQGIRYLKRAIDKEFLELEFSADIVGDFYNDI